ncbi:hypothetical protein F7734_09460 [Scytonema sp. UIC 10036]|nr:hypothetical protein [Scytonema sp. UIC 10036]
MTIWLHFLSYGSNRSAALPGTRAFRLAYSSRSLGQRLHADHGSGSTPQHMKTLLISCPNSNIPALSAVEVGQIQRSVSICFLAFIRTMYLIATNKSIPCHGKSFRRVAFPPRYK